MEQDNSMPLSSLMRRVPTQFFLPGAVFLAVVMIGCVLTALQPKLYEAQARIWVQPRSQTSQKQEILPPLSTFFTSPLVTASEIIKSGVVLKEAVEILRREKVVPVPAQDEIASHLTASPVTNADVLKVAYTSTNNQQASTILQAILEAFEQVGNVQSEGSATKYRVSMEKHVDMLRKRSNEDRKALKEFKDRNQAVSLPEQVSSLLKQSAASEAEIEKYKLRIAEMRSKIDYLHSQLGLGPEDALLAYKLSQDEGLTVLRKKMALDRARLVSLRGAYRDEHPYIKELNTAIAAAKAEVEQRVKALGVESGREIDTDRLSSDDAVRQKLLEDMVSARSEEISAQSGLTQTVSLLADTNARLANIPAAQVQLAELGRKETVSSEALSDAERSVHNAQLNETVASYSANTRVIDWPTPPKSPKYPNVPLNVGLSVLIGLMFAVLALLAGPVVWRPSEVQRILNLPIIDWMKQLPCNGALPASIIPLHRLRLGMQHLLSSERKCIVVTSPDREDGKTLIASSLAIGFAESGLRVLLIDANLERPGLHRVFGIPAGPGLTDYQIAEGADSILRNSRAYPSLAIISRGNTEARFGSLTSTKLRELIRAHSSKADVIIVDTPAFKDSPDSLSMLQASDLLLVVVSLNHTSRTSIKVFQSQLRHCQLAAAGVVLVGTTDRAVVGVLQAEEQNELEEASV